jgi:hypothetical protein
VPIAFDLDTTRAAENFEAADRRDENAAAPPNLTGQAS